MQLLIFLLVSFAWAQSGARVQSPVWLGIMASDAACTSPGGATANGIYALAGSPVTLRQCIGGSSSALISGGGGGVTVGAALPGTCTVGDLYYLNVATVGLYGCNATNTWTLIGTGSITTSDGFVTITGGTVVSAGTTAPLLAADNSMTGANNVNYNRITTAQPNAGTTGTTLNRLAKLTGAPSTAIVAATTDTSGLLGIVASGSGTTGNAVIATRGVTPCDFDGGTTAGHYVQASTTTAGQCHDAGATRPTAGQVLGYVLSSNGGANTYNVLLEPDSVAGGGGSSFYMPVDFQAACYSTSIVVGGAGWASSASTLQPYCLAGGGILIITNAAATSDVATKAFRLPPGFPTSATWKIVWFTASAGAADNVKLGTSYVCKTPGSNTFRSPTFPAVTYVTTAVTVGQVNRGYESSWTLDLSGCAAGDYLWLQVNRDNSVGSNLADWAQLSTGGIY